MKLVDVGRIMEPMLRGLIENFVVGEEWHQVMLSV